VSLGGPKWLSVPTVDMTYLAGPSARPEMPR
jgi:hypothetical protein